MERASPLRVPDNGADKPGLRNDFPRSGSPGGYASAMRESVTLHMRAPAEEIWRLVADVRNTGRFSPETFDAEWLDGASGPALGVRFRGHVKRNEVGPVYWTTCRITACRPGREFGFQVLLGKPR
jgi:hypothetical protein